MISKEPPHEALLKDAISKVLERMLATDPESDEYAQMTKQLSELYKMQNSNDESAARFEELNLKRDELNKPDRVKMDTWALVGANLVGILIMVNYERAHVLTSKALGFIGRLPK